MDAAVAAAVLLAVGSSSSSSSSSTPDPHRLPRISPEIITQSPRRSNNRFLCRWLFTLCSAAILAHLYLSESIELPILTIFEEYNIMTL